MAIPKTKIALIVLAILAVLGVVFIPADFNLGGIFEGFGVKPSPPTVVDVEVPGSSSSQSAELTAVPPDTVRDTLRKVEIRHTPVPDSLLALPGEVARRDSTIAFLTGQWLDALNRLSKYENVAARASVISDRPVLFNVAGETYPFPVSDTADIEYRFPPQNNFHVVHRPLRSKLPDSLVAKIQDEAATPWWETALYVLAGIATTILTSQATK